MKISKADKADLPVLEDMFWKHISEHPQYISHGEVQMGVGTAVWDGTSFKGVPSANGKGLWEKYINAKYESPMANILTAKHEETITGFCVMEITDDGADEFGVICDLLVNAECRCKGIGGKLLDAALEWFAEKGIRDIYLESGKDNHSAHEFFRNRGFGQISEIYKLSEQKSDCRN